MNILYLARGIPGSGKSHRALELAGGDESLIHSADKYFVREGVYTFDLAQRGNAHAQCRDGALAAIARRDPVVIIDNTNVTVKEMKPYALAAFEAGYSVEIAEPTSEWWLRDVKPACLTKDPALIAQAADLLSVKNVHGVPLETLRAMMGRWQDVTAGDIDSWPSVPVARTGVAE